MNNQNNNVLTTIYFASISAMLIITVTTVAAAQTQAQQSQQIHQGKFFMIFKIRKSQCCIDRYDVYNMTTNMKKFPTSSPNDKIEYNLKDIYVNIYDCNIWWYIPYKIVDTSTPHIIRTKEATIASSSIIMNCIKEVNTLTNTTTYTGQSSVGLIDSHEWLYNNVNIKATIYPNGTGIVESKEL